MRWVRRILLLVLLVALPVGVHLFVTRNAAEVPLDFLAVRFEGVAVWVALICAFGAGAAWRWPPEPSGRGPPGR